jgi:pimeloyl-ACP methyl ester carboxylesterase
VDRPRWIPLDDGARGFQRFEWLERELKKSKLPTLLVRGREDEVFDHEDVCDALQRNTCRMPKDPNW